MTTERAVGSRESDGEVDSKLKRGITGPLLFLFILGDVLGAGIYALLGVLSQDVGGVLWAPLLVALMPVLGVASCVVLLTQQTAKVWLFAAVVLAVGAVLYLVARVATRSRVDQGDAGGGGSVERR